MNSNLFSKEEKRANGIVYTPTLLSEFVASKVISYFLADLAKDAGANTEPKIFLRKLKSFRFIDPACGGGELLCSIWNQLVYQLPKFFPSLNRALTLTPGDLLFGIDNDSKAIAESKKRISNLYPKRFNGRLSHNFITTNALFPFNRKICKEGWQQVFNKLNIIDGFDIVIANPPWGADVENYKKLLTTNEYSLFNGQFDSSDLFMERALEITKPSGYFAFIVPDSLFGTQRKNLRKLLLSKTEIKFIGRLGEKIFSKINRGCAVIICKLKAPNSASTTQCFRLSPYYKNLILKKELSLLAVQDSISHHVAQSRFAKNMDYRFDIDLSSDEEGTLNKFNSLKSYWEYWLQSSRGTELSKNGFVCQCTNCGNWIPRPNMLVKICSFCKCEFKLSVKNLSKIIDSKKINGSKPIFVGEHIQRYQLKKNYWIDTKKRGINYKPQDLFQGPKILIRKTGVGVSATIDYSNSMTNQVVYMFRVKDSFNEMLPLELFLGIINSRALYYFIIKSHGETEWRSHPYITQRQILDLPIPNEKVLLNKFKLNIEILSKLIRKFSLQNKPISPAVDSKIEFLVSQIYGLDKRDYKNIYKTIEKSEEMIPVKALKNISIEDIFSNKSD